VNVLIVEDDVQLSELLGRVFHEEGYTRVVCGTLKEADQALASTPFDIVVLDWMLPDGDGIDLCARLRERPRPIPVLMLTARGEVHDRVAGLRTGADDYLTKPFEIEELLARVEAVHRRVNQGWTTRAGALELDRRAQLVRAGGKRLDLTSREYSLLARLADAPDECVSRSMLLLDVWNMTFDPGSGVIDVHVSRLRDKLGELAWMVETVRGQGLRLRTTR
jgi:DNA-binding response OmpR family regulator